MVYVQHGIETVYSLLGMMHDLRLLCRMFRTTSYFHPLGVNSVFVLFKIQCKSLTKIEPSSAIYTQRNRDEYYNFYSV